MKTMEFQVETDREADGRWIAEIASLPGVMAYGDTKRRAISRTTALAMQVLADRIEHGEMAEAPDQLFFRAA